MPEIGWRERLKSGSLSGIYGAARRVKRRIKREPIAGVVAMPVSPFGLDQLQGLESELGHTGRFRYSMAWCHFDEGRYVLSIAWGITALAAYFEAPERAALLVAVAAHRIGSADTVAKMLPYLRPDEMTVHEMTLFEEVKHQWTNQISHSPLEFTLEADGALLNEASKVLGVDKAANHDAIRLFNSLKDLPSADVVKSPASPE